MKKPVIAILLTILAVSFAPKSGHGQRLSLPAINIAQGKKIEATSTCGEDVSEQELFCKLATVAGKFEILGLSCDHCDPSVSSKNHSIMHAIDGTEKWWQSPPLSRGLQYQRVNITIDLGQEYQVAYIIIKTGNAPRPGTWALEKSVDGGKTFTPWQYFATDNSDCLTYFGHSALLQSFKDDTTVTCTTSYSQVPPFENGEIHISLVNGRPGASNFSYSQALQEWTRATHIRLRLLKVKTLLADLLPLARKDPSVTRRYFYSIKDISVGGICMCNGHADDCVQLPDDSQFRCSCKHQTCGVKCEECCRGFVQKKWKPATAESSNECEPCNCHNHAIECYYSERIAQEKRSLDINGNYEGGGVCVNCKDNTYGINCERCKPGYYRPTGVPKTSRDACQACTCDRRFSTGRCYDGDGRCECLENYSGPNCDQCNEGFYGFPNCKPCDCHPLGTTGRVCGPTGDQCPCKPNYTGAKCDQCAPGYYGFPNCRRCNCDSLGSLSSNCETTTGQCNCRQMYTARQCNQCSKGFYRFPECKVCNCDAEGTARDICDPNTGICICMKNFAGPRCDVCNEGYYRFPVCRGCGCSAQGSVSPKCNEFGVCECQQNYDGTRCDRCRLGHYSYPRCVKCSCDPRGSVHEFCDPSTGQCNCKGSFRGLNCNRCRSGYYGFPDCQACQCNPAGIKPLPDGQLVDCSLSNEGQCNCKDNVQGLACTECKDGYYFLQSSNPLGCNSCECNMDGVIGGLRTCDKFTGQCPCKLYVAGRKCTSCKAGFYGLAGSKVFGCTGCDCDVGGAYDQFCDITSGQCRCRTNVVGRDCSRPAPRHYYPTLLHIMAELEDATAVSTKQGSVPGQDVLSPEVSLESDGTPARFGFDESVFPGYSWRGYATMSDLQRALKVTLDIPKTTRYHIIFRSITNESSPVTGKVMLTPKGGVGSKQSSQVTFPVKQVGSTNVAVHHTVGDKGMPTQFMLTKGQWDLMLVLPPASVLLDYVAALPQEYYEAYRLEDKVTKPCQVNGINTLCNQFSYLSTKKPGLFTTELETGYIIRTSGKLTQTQLFKDEAVLQQLDFSAMALLDNTQNRVTADFKIPKSGKYVFVLQYYHPSDSKAKLNVYLRYPQGTQRGEFNLQRCNYRFGCRQVAVDSNGAVKVFDVSQIQRMVVTLLARDSSSPIAVDSITAIPLDMWTLDFIAPSILCTTQGSECIPTSYPNPKGAVKIEADGSDPNQPQPPNKQDPKVKLQYLKGPKIHVLAGPVPRPGQYAAIVHYYQPNHASFDSQVSVTSDRALDGSMKFHYCPHASGCRSVIRDLNASPFFNIGRNSVALEFTIPENSSTWIDYVLLVPRDLFTEDLQEDAPVPLTQAFLDSCSKDDFFIKSSDPKFCKDSVFSLTTAFSNGSRSCNCNLKGSLSSDCEQFGGQCPCRQNVIGRTCSRCKTGYYGFPNCRKCRCVFCNEITGACDCPPNTVGPNCEFCLQGTCCYDPILGCQDCGCERFGVEGGNIACNPSTGQCNCKPSHTGKKCNKCATGYYDYPLCQKCDSCDSRGVDSRICDSNDGTCFCKPGVTGRRCDKCAAGRFNLDAKNPDGCSECWCNGLSDTCDSGNKYWSKVDTMDNWQLENSPAIVVKIGDTNLYASISSQREEKGKPIYWVAPKEFLGQKISSYGGKLSYTTRYEVPQGEGSPILTTKPDVVIEGKNGKVLHNKRQLQLTPGKTSAIEVQFLEYLWQDASGSNVSRDDLMSVLHDITSLKLRASYSTVVAEVTINDVKMDVAVDGPLVGAARANSVEVCDCPERATGASCELCGKGYTRAADNTTCVPCNCFGHSDDCDGETGKCNNCLHNTTGLNCEVCEPGYYGDATVGSEQDCGICECPLGIMSNSFATECALNSFNDLLCKCQEGYIGQRCERCADGFYGNPSQPGDYCKRCVCSGNIDNSVNGSCDTQTGQCLKCINAATGDQCEHCLNGYFGDAVVAKNCARCACSDCGTVTAVCNHTTGVCKCKPNVIGDSCDSCKPNTWNFDSCLGCEDCACAPASLSASCDVKTGQCDCPEGVTGRRCDRCKAGYFAYSAGGCQPCNCAKGEENLFGFCDINTGQCCKPGGNCTICPQNYILTPEGCEYCGECVGRLLNTSTNLDRDLTQALKSLEQGTAGIIAEGRFSDINETLQRLIPPTNKYNTTMEELRQFVGVSSAEALPDPLAIYPLNAKHGGKDTGPNSNRAAKLSNAPPVAGPYGNSDGSRQLKGRPDSYVEIPNEGSLDTRKSTSILVWVYHERMDGPIVDYEANKPVNLWLYNSKYRLQLMNRDRSPSAVNTLTSSTVLPNAWNHVAATYDYDSGLAKLWVNEKLEDEANIGINELATDSISVLMGRLEGLPFYFKGRVACLQFYDKALALEQIDIAKRACDPAAVNSSFNATVIAGTLTERTDSSEEATEEVKQVVMKITDKATQGLDNATSTKDEALALEQEIKEALNRTHGIIDFAENIAKTLKTDKANQTLLLEEAEEILKELVNRNFDAVNLTMTKEEELVMGAIDRAKSMLNDTVGLWSQLKEANKTLNELLGKFASILDKTSSVLENTSLALETNTISKSYDSQTPLTKAAMKKKEVDSALMNLQDAIHTTKSKLFNGSSSLQSFNGSFPRLDDLIDQVTKRMANISQSMDELTPSVVMAQNHSKELRKQADELEKLLTDIEFANKAVNASQRYSDISQALKEALAIAQEAEEIAMDARDESQNVNTLAKNSQNVSSVLNETALRTKDKVDNELSSLLDDIKSRLDLIKSKIQNVSRDLFDVENNFPEFSEKANSIGEKTEEIGENSTQSKMVADDAWEKAEEIEEQLTGLSGLKESIIATNRNITEAEEKVMKALNMTQVIKDKVVIQEQRQEKIIAELDTEVALRLKDIRQMMDRAHNLLKYTSLVMKFDGKTTSAPLPPRAVQQETRSLNFLMYMKPEKPDGLVLFMGDAGKANRYRQKRQSQQCRSDFLAVELKAARPHLKMCTSGRYLDFETAENILTDGNRWYKLEAGMTGDLARLSITYFDKTEIRISRVRSLGMNNPKIMFNKDSDLVVGGVPMKMKLPAQVDAVNYTGCFDGLQVNNHFVGSWNSDPLEKPDKDEYCFPRSGDAEFAAEEETPSRTFFGTGYLKSGPYGDDAMGEMDFKFTTTSSNGILVIAIDDDDTSLFQAMELSDGHIVFSYNMGYGFRRLSSSKVYDTGDEVTIEKAATDFFGDKFNLKISSSQGEEVLASNKPFYKGRRSLSFVNADYVYWGGIENRTTIPVNVTKRFFKGCLTSLSLSTGVVKIQPSPGFILGCAVKPAYNVTFLEDHSYLAFNPFLDTRRRGFNIGLSFRVGSETKNGLIFLEAHSGDKDFIVLGLVNGKVTFSANAGSLPLTLQTDNKFNDGKWHFVSVEKDGVKMYLYVDSLRETGEFQDKMQQYIQTTQDMYLGGVPADYMDTVRNRDFDSVILNSLKGGSIKDLTFEHELYDFMKYKARKNVIFDDDDYSEQTPKNLFIETTGPPTGGTTNLPSTTPKSTTMPSTPEKVTTPPPPITSPTTPPPTTQPPVCPMPEKPAQQAGVMGFGHDLNSHVVYAITKGSVLYKLISKRTKLSFEFRASNPNGILLYTGEADFIECHLENGKVSCSFSAGGGILKLTTLQASYSDGKWHTVRLMRKEVNGTLYVDDKKVATGRAAGSPTVINGLTVLYLGGTPEGFDAKRVPTGSRLSLPGCIRNVTVSNIDIGLPTSESKIQDCYRDSPASGVSFEEGGGFLKVANGYTVGKDEVIMVELKPTSHTGVLLSSSSAKGDYIVLEMINGSIIFRAENGGGQLVVEYAAQNPLELCDGQWRTVKAWKDKTVVRLQVDGGSTLEGGGKGSQTDANIYDPLYVGGIPDGVVAKGVTATEPYTGCIRNLQSMDPGKQPKTLYLTKPIEMAGNVYLGGCPYN